MARDPVATGLKIAKRRQVLNRAGDLRTPSEPMMRQEDLAARLGVAPSTVANWERGKSYPVRYLGALEAVLQISLTDEEPQPEPAPDSQVLEIRAMTWLTAAEQDQWIAVYEARKPPQERAG